ncbi:MAG: hypothetical protein RIR94_674 [Bacteroidota bacterium]
MRSIIFILLFSPLSYLAQQEVSYPSLQSTFDFYLRQTGLQKNNFALRLFTPDPQLFAENQSWGSDGFGVVTNQKQIFIYGNTEQAFQNGLYDVLQRKFGFEYYQAEAVQIPNVLPKNFAFDKYESIPAFTYREVFYGETRRSGFADWHKLTSGASAGTFENHPGWGLWVHTLHRLLPPEQYFETHPEYYALRNGVRLKDQVCLSNPEVLDIVCDNLAKEIAKNPKAKYWSVSQMDNYNYCQCNACHHTDSLEKSQAGTMLRFVNEVAKRFPKQTISTLAYQYTRSAPVLTKPEPNVNIMLCTIEEDRAKSLRGTSFEKDLKNWAALTHNILIWDYVINFSHMVMPFPNWPTLQENLQMFQAYGVQMLFEQGYNAPSSEMQPLRAYLLSKWSWDPTLDVNLLLKNFTDYFYGPAGSIVREVLQTQVKELQMSGKALTLYEPPITHIGGYLNPASLKWALQMYEKAIGLPGMSSAQIARIEMALQSIRYALIEVGKSPLAGPDWYFNDNQVFYNKLLSDFTRIALKNGPKLLHETKLPPDEYALKTKQFWTEARVQHLAKNQKIKYHSLPAANYKDGLNLLDTTSWTLTSSINDGLRSTQEYQRGWQGWQGQDAHLEIQLSKQYVIDSVRIHYLANNQSWIMGPSYLEANGKNVLNQVFKIRTDNPFVNLAQMNGAYPLTLKDFPNAPIQNIELTIGNPGPLPKWRGVAGDGWLFIDEIEVYGHEK